ncbi:hypothetical protein MVEN_01651400 [Mycena venus]|uniref:Uncharacterized protein n=1 Tax=Mycena venus TaxID=2733690 RepID=A0A8H7CQV3_9AGAR|nr:hypothetical protein MVEN_01651400 [Mycena venus]
MRKHLAPASSSGGACSEVGTEEDRTHFDLSGAPAPPAKDKAKAMVGDAYAELEGDDGFVDIGGEVEIEDDWVDPVTPAPKKGLKGKGRSKSKKTVGSAQPALCPRRMLMQGRVCPCRRRRGSGSGL